MSSSKYIRKNLLYSIGTRACILTLGLIIPRLVITSFGSDVNGLVATINQIFTYLALLEAGIGKSALNALYRPLEEKNYETANEVFTEAQAYYRRVAVIYGLCIAAFSVIYPLLARTNLSKPMTFGIIILQGGASFIGYFFTACYSVLLTADRKHYINENIGFITYVVTSVIKIILILRGCNILAVQISHFVITVFRVPVIIALCRKKYPWLNDKEKKPTHHLKERGAFVVHEVSNTVFGNTDVFLISVFCSFSVASVYTVYNMVYSSLLSLLIYANSGLGFVLGQNVYKGEERLTKIYDIYSVIYSLVVYILFTASVILIVPFVKLYTKGVSDIDYLIPGLPILFTAIQLLSGVRAIGSLLINVSGHADKTKNRSMFEAIINLVSSVILVSKFGLKGVLYGTIIALLYRTNDIIIYANRKILHRCPWKEYKNIIMNTLIFCVIYYLSLKMNIQIDNYGQFILYGFIITATMSIIYLIANVVSHPALVSSCISIVRKKIKQEGC